MNYLGEQVEALNTYSKEAICWLSIKFKGRYNSRTKPDGYTCGESSCSYCNSKQTIRRDLDQDFYNLFSINDIKEIIRAKPNRLIEIWNEKSTLYIGSFGKSPDYFKEQCKKMFVDSGYKDWFLDERKNYALAKLLEQHTCNYCNREYIFIYEKKGKGMVPQFDHWFPKKDFPLLALSFYNLIPSCATCNTIKSSDNLNLSSHLHPYIDENIASSYSFSYIALGSTKNQIVFKNNSLFNTKGIDTVKALNLELIYQGHSDKELQDLIDLRYKYSTNYLNILLEKMFPDIDISKEERYRLIFGIEIEKENYHKRIFSKFKDDIIKELVSIK
ncbi:HNH endonuclease [Elizabethkingia anophelis]|uniref:HNH endonuclease n=1 Tax=Elizabethkingia anophelis TaxID=1117645 RepID=UPI0020B3E4AF|nr:hypothetical protein [Elizabethkingia anophelis]MDV3864767.1 hypothetical protein [Elizabethkingia anophelis]MDV4140747.1 hypothetical protein [Elizabethkingia anophelis]UTF95868.1 hypothetical protein J2N94_13890 [Elizabethkingia anophelis]